MLIFWAVLGGFLLDALFGDPAWLPHPVVLMGRCISALEKHLRTALPKTPRGELAGGAAVAAVLPLGTLAVTGLACWAAARLHPALGLALQMLWCGQALAAKGLAQESRNVYKELAKGDLPAARRAVARIVGRDTQNLTAAGVTRAAVYQFHSAFPHKTSISRTASPSTRASRLSAYIMRLARRTSRGSISRSGSPIVGLS